MTTDLFSAGIDGDHTVITCILLKHYVVCEDFCGPNFCGNSKQHTMCKYKIDSPASTCVMYEKIINGDKDKQEVLDKINSRRNKVSSGEIRSLPSASNMMKLVWNEELAQSAQRWADQCVSNGALVDVCRNLENTSVGQNIATVYGEAPRLNPATLVDLWYMELLNFNAAVISRYQPSSATNLEHYDYFTQLVWGNTSQVGCGASKFNEELPKNKNRTVYRLVCNFIPSGNIEGQRVYNEGLPCTHCPYDNVCDSQFTSLCDQSHINLETHYKSEEGINNKSYDLINYNPGILFDTESLISLETKEANESHQKVSVTVPGEVDLETDISFDLFAHLYNNNNKAEEQKTENTSLCKNILAVDEFIDLVRKKLSTDNLLKDLLTTKSLQSDNQYSDPKVDAIVSKIYSKNTPSTTTKSTDSDIINSTLLVNLVEAIIFRNRDKLSTVEVVIPNTEVAEARTVQMQAELGEIQRNLEFTGHYFFPEEGEENQSDPTESYYDQSNIPISEIVLEIEDLKRNKETKDFVEEILESDFNAETITPNHVITNENTNDMTKLTRKERIHRFWNNSFSGPKVVKRPKRSNNIIKTTRNKINHQIRFYHGDDMLLSYNELLKLLAADLKELKLNDKFHCAHNLATATATFPNTSISTVVITSIFVFILLQFIQIFIT